ncbi:response regulator [Deinococcus radiopugnans]|uniref:CheY-like chemotaxis protein n=1 Tax=Deinococcus radiopugnans ATCC 19172 TaxID=585398 RepID=A0A5C4YBE2_9DEIO|nr:response regulator [Deinococcus radiopugnans]MBB6015448.1 CheY-like chemotaxis protein [Deinococcus radiopugnans ATCC 19172]QLG13043.1 response regulator [Deinococcus sp. D7000]TNM72867.1 response regulator [Deinococcus radiopugnans ATCC 19172]
MPQIFIVDDSISVRKALEITFKRHSLDSFSAVSAEQALETLAADPHFDLMMADVIMPGMSGLELCSELRRDGRFDHLPIVLMSGNVDEDIKRQAREVGANGVLRKPFSPDELIPMVEDLLRAAEAQTAAALTAAPAAAEAPAAEPAAPSQLERLIAEYRRRGDVEDLIVLDAQGQLVLAGGEAGTPGAAERLPMYARHFVATASVIGQHLLGDELQAVTLRYAGREAIFHPQDGFLVIALTRMDLKTLN